MQSLIICIDNSEYTRNGDFGPSRLMQQREAVTELLRVQMRSNPENDIALMTTSSRRNSPEMLLPLSREQVVFQRKLYAAESQGTGDPITSLRIAQLALKHRKNVQANQRVVLFLGSPLNEDKNKTSEKHLKHLGLALRKANISLDLIVFGSVEEVAKIRETLQPLVIALGPCSCQLIAVHPNQVISQQLLQQLNWLTETVQRAGAAVLGDDESQDPELMMAVQMSMKEAAMKEIEGKKQSKANFSATKSNSGPSGKMPLPEKSYSKVTAVGAKEGTPTSKNCSASSSVKSIASEKGGVVSSAADDDDEEGEETLEKLLQAVLAMEQKSQRAAMIKQKQRAAASRIPVAIKTGFLITKSTRDPSHRGRSSGKFKDCSINLRGQPKHKMAERRAKAKAAATGAAHIGHPNQQTQQKRPSSFSKYSLNPLAEKNLKRNLNSRFSFAFPEKSGSGGKGKAVASGSKQQKLSKDQLFGGKSIKFIGFYKSGDCTLKEKEKEKSSKAGHWLKSNLSTTSSSSEKVVHSKKVRKGPLVNTKKIQEMINAKKHSLEAIAASKVVGPENGPPPPSSTTVAGRPPLKTSDQAQGGSPSTCNNQQSKQTEEKSKTVSQECNSGGKTQQLPADKNDGVSKVEKQVEPDAKK